MLKCFPHSALNFYFEFLLARNGGRAEVSLWKGFQMVELRGGGNGEEGGREDWTVLFKNIISVCCLKSVLHISPKWIVVEYDGQLKLWITNSWASTSRNAAASTRNRRNGMKTRTMIVTRFVSWLHFEYLQGGGGLIYWWEGITFMNRISRPGCAGRKSSAGNNRAPRKREIKLSCYYHVPLRGNRCGLLSPIQRWGRGGGEMNKGMTQRSRVVNPWMWLYLKVSCTGCEQGWVGWTSCFHIWP